MMKFHLSLPYLQLRASVSLAILFSVGLISCSTESLTPHETNKPPRIYSIQITPRDTVEVGDTLTLRCNADDPEGDSLGYNWAYCIDTITVDPNRNPPDSLKFLQDRRTPFQVRWPACEPTGLVTWMVTVNDTLHWISYYDFVWVVPWGTVNRGPRIESMWADEDTVIINDSVRVYCEAIDPNGDSLTYDWFAERGSIRGYHSEAVWTAPNQVGRCSIEVDVSDGADTVHGELPLMVKEPDTLIFYDANYDSTDQVTDYWEYLGLLEGLGTVIGERSIAWDSDQQAMAAIGKSDYGTHSFRLKNYRFSQGTFSIDIKAANSQFGGIGFLPKFIDLRNYLLISINFFQPQYQILQCVDGQLSYIQSEWIQYPPTEFHTLSYTRTGNEYAVSINGEEKWRGSVHQVFQSDVQVGVSVYGLAYSGPALFDNLHIAKP
ncbi:MAG: hypothetical protein V2A61_08115 [Calditrichota bacterium]